MPVSVKYNREVFNARITKRAAQALKAAALVLDRECRIAVGQPNTGESRTRTRDTSRGKAGSQYTVYPHPSRPGEPPRLRTGFGRSSIFNRTAGTEKNPIEQVGVLGNGAYMFLLEVGTKHIARRPWLLATLERVKPKMVQAIKTISAMP